jgi:hypothetical protein
MAQHGNILTIRLGVPEPGQVLPWSGVPFEDGWRALMSVVHIVARVQSTVVFGNSLYMIWNSVGSMSPQQGLAFFLKPYFNIPMVFGQLSEPPFAAIPGRYRTMMQTPPPLPPVAVGTSTILSTGFDPLRGYWIEFQGNYFLHYPIFKDWGSVTRDGPNFSGFQPTGSPKQK